MIHDEQDFDVVFYLNAVHNGWVEDVHAGVNLVGDELGWFLDKVGDSAVIIVDDNTILGRFLNFGDLRSRIDQIRFHFFLIQKGKKP